MIVQFWAKAFPGAQTISFNDLLLWRKVPISSHLTESQFGSMFKAGQRGDLSTSHGARDCDYNYEWRPIAHQKVALKDGLVRLEESDGSSRKRVRDFEGCLEGLWELEGGRRGMTEALRKLFRFDREREEETETEEEESVTEEESDTEEE